MRTNKESSPHPPTPRRRTSARSIGVGLTVAALVAAGAPALAHGRDPGSSTGAPAVTRAALDPALVAGRGAEVAFQEQEAESADTNGTVLAPSRDAYTLAAEASGRSAVALDRGEKVTFTLPRAANAITVRYSIPDAADGGGITSPLTVTASAGSRSPVSTLTRTMTLTSQYSWLYNQYPFTNDPDAQMLNPGWWTVECDAAVPDGCDPATRTVETPFRPFHMYDEQRLLLGRTFPAGATVTLAVPRDATADVTTVDLLDSELVGLPYVTLRAANVLAFGADPTGRRDSAGALDKAIAWAKKKGLPVYVPPGVFAVSRHIVVDDVTIRGAGSWYTVFKGSEVTLDEPADDGSLHTGVGFYGKDAATGGSSDVHLSGFAIQGDVRERIDTDQVNGIGGAFDDSSFDSLYIQHTKVGLWLDGPMRDVSVTNNVIVDQIADGINFHRGVSDSVASDNFFRNTGDDAMAMWSDAAGDAPENARNTFSHNTIQTPTLANGIAIYGGRDITVEGNLVADPVREGSALHLGARFGSTPFAGDVSLTDNTTVRAGGLELNWKFGLGALWIYALDQSIDANIEVTGDHYLDSTYNAIMEITDWEHKDVNTITGVRFKDLRIDGAGTSAFNARVEGSASFENVDVRNLGWAGVNNCGSFGFPDGRTEFELVDLGGNDGTSLDPWAPGTVSWLGRFVPSAPSCQDTPPVVAPPAPTPWS